MDGMTAVALDIVVQTQASDLYSMEMRLILGDHGAQSALSQASVRIDQMLLRAMQLDPHSYGRTLSTMLFADEQSRQGFIQARAYAAGAGKALRVRLQLPDTLQDLLWETLYDPLGNSPLALNEQIWMARIIDSSTLHMAPVPRLSALTALVAVSSPRNLSTFGMQSIDVVSEAAAARMALDNISATMLARELSAHPLTVPALLAALRDGPQLLYLLAHGSWIDGVAYIWLEDERGHAAPTPAHEIASALGSLHRPPLLTILVSCEGASANGVQALNALGPQLTRAGVPAVIAMQGRFSMATAARFTPALLRELRRHGVVDRALTIARQSVRSAQDWWMPVLFTRMSDSRIWQGDVVAQPTQASPRPTFAPPRLDPGRLTTLRQVLRACDEFQSQRQLYALFGADELRLWQDRLPEAESRNARIDLVIDFLRNRRRADGQAGIPLMLHALVSCYDPDDDRYVQLRTALDLFDA